MNDATPDPVTTLRVEPLTREAFAPFGEVIAFGAATKVTGKPLVLRSEERRVGKEC